MNAYDMAKVWLAQSVNRLSTDEAALDAFIQALKLRIGIARDNTKSFDKTVPKLERWQVRIDNQHQLQVLVPALRLAYSLKQGSKRAMKGYELATFLLACATNSNKNALYAAPAGYMSPPTWPELSRRIAAELVNCHPALFAGLPEVLARASRGVASAQFDLDREQLLKRKLMLHDRILSEMKLSEEESALLRRFLA